MEKKNSWNFIIIFRPVKYLNFPRMGTTVQEDFIESENDNDAFMLRKAICNFQF